MTDWHMFDGILHLSLWRDGGWCRACGDSFDGDTVKFENREYCRSCLTRSYEIGKADGEK